MPAFTTSSPSLVALVGLAPILASACAASPAPPPPPPPAIASSAPPPSAAPTAADLAQQALACSLLETGEFAPGCAALATFLAPAVVRTEAGHTALAELVQSKDVKAQALAAKGYAAAVDKTRILTVKELAHVLALFGSSTSLPIVNDLGPVIRVTVSARPRGPEAAALAAFLAKEDDRPVGVSGPGKRAEALLQGRELDDVVVPGLLFQSKDPWSRTQGRDALLASTLSPAQKCEVLATDVAGGGDPERNFLDALRLDCAEAEKLALAAVVKRAKEATWLEAAQTIPSWPFEDLVPLCKDRDDRRPSIVAALRTVLAGGPNVEPKIRERAFDDLATCDRAAAKETAKGYRKDKDADVAATARLLLAPEPKSKKPPKR